jgi:hypothetical protein
VRGGDRGLTRTIDRCLLARYLVREYRYGTRRRSLLPVPYSRTSTYGTDILNTVRCILVAVPGGDAARTEVRARSDQRRGTRS